jgi:mannose-1-phosphate guanylyltransferase
MGALSLIKGKINSTFLVINGDVLTDLSINAFTAFHRQHRGLLSVAVAKRNVHIDFGVIEQQANLGAGFIEKPLLCHIVSTGIYCLEPEILDLIPNGVPFGFDDLMHCMLGKKLAVHTFLHNGLWLDIGRVEDFQQAQELAWEDLAPSVEMAAA